MSWHLAGKGKEPFPRVSTHVWSLLLVAIAVAVAATGTLGQVADVWQGAGTSHCSCSSKPFFSVLLLIHSAVHWVCRINLAKSILDARLFFPIVFAAVFGYNSLSDCLARLARLAHLGTKVSGCPPTLLLITPRGPFCCSALTYCVVVPAWVLCWP